MTGNPLKARLQCDPECAMPRPKLHRIPTVAAKIAFHSCRHFGSSRQTRHPINHMQHLKTLIFQSFA